MTDKVRVLIHGTGFAGQGHTDGFRYAGAEVVGIVGRRQQVVDDLAAAKGIAYAGTDWRQASIDLKPDAVSIATPGGAHFEAIKEAISHGCHVFCDKPITIEGWQATELYN